MITICIAGGCFAVAIMGYRIGSIYGYILSAVSVVVGLLLFFNGLRLLREKKANALIAGQIQKQLGTFLFDCGFKTVDEVPFNRPFLAFDNTSEQLLCGMPKSGCICVPFGRLLGFRLYEKGEATVESEDFDERYDELFPDTEDDYAPKSKGLALLLIFDDKSNPLYEIEFAEAVYPKNSFLYKDELRRLKKYAGVLKNLLEEYELDDAGSIKVWEYKG